MKKGGKMGKTNQNEKRKKDDCGIQTAGKNIPDLPVRAAGTLLCLFFALCAAFSLTGTLRAQAGTGSTKTKVITTTTDESFAVESAKLAKKKRGLSVQDKGTPPPFSSARLIVGLKTGKKVDFSKYNATTVVESNFGVSIVQFSSESAAKKAASSLKKLSSVRYVDADDCTLDLGDTVIKKIYYDESSYEKDLGTSSLSRDAADAASYDKAQLNNFDYTYEETVKQNALTASSSAMSWGVSVIEADKYAAYVKACTTRSVIVAVVDSGVSYHPRMEGRLRTGIDLVDNDSSAADENGHGTHVAGTVVDCTPGIKVYIMPVRVMNASGAGSPSVVGNGIRYAVSKGAKVINLSLGGYSHYQYLEECINYAHNKGVTVVIASGNENENTKYVCPAHMTNPVIVGSVTRDKKRASYSNYGSSLDLVAPGEDIISCWMGGGYAVASGTSMAAPHVSAAAAMYRLMYPTYGSSKTQIMLRSFVQDLGATGTDIYYGRGLPRMTGPIKPTKVTLSKTAAKLELKKTLTLKATITPSYAGQKTLTWSSGNTAVATVSAGGKVTAKKKGTATITVEAVGGKKASCKVTVIGIQPVSVKPSLTSKTLEVGSSVTLKGTVTPADAENKTLTWSSNNTAVATVSSGGKVTAKKKGTATITVKTVNGKKATCKVTVIGIRPTAVTLNLTAKKLEEGSSVTLKGTVTPSGAENKTLTWSSSDTTVATVSSGGKVTAKKKGTATITAKTVNNKKAVCKVTVIGIQPAAVTFDVTEKTLEMGSSFTLKATVSPSNAENKTLTWQSGSEAIATVKAGKVTAAGEGTVTIKAVTANGKKAVCKVVVVPGPTLTSSAESQPEVLDGEESVSAPSSDTAQETAAEEETAAAAPLQSIEEQDLPDAPVQSEEEEKEEDLPEAVVQPEEEEEQGLPDAVAQSEAEEEEDSSAGPAQTPEETSLQNTGLEPETGEDSMDTDSARTVFLSLDKEVYTAVSGEQSVEFLAGVRLPGAPDTALSVNESEDQPYDDAGEPAVTAQTQDTPYVLAMLREEQDGSRTLLGAVDLASGQDKENRDSFAGILSMTGAVKNEDTWELSLLADISLWMAESGPQELDPEQEEIPEGYYSGIIEGCRDADQKDGMLSWKCALAVYDSRSFEEREYASSIPDPESCSLIDAGAVCSCPFTLNLETETTGAASDEDLYPDADVQAEPEETEGYLPDEMEERQDGQVPGELTKPDSDLTEDTEDSVEEEGLDTAMEADPDTETDPDIEIIPDSDTETETDQDADPDSNSDPDSETDSDA